MFGCRMLLIGHLRTCEPKRHRHIRMILRLPIGVLMYHTQFVLVFLHMRRDGHGLAQREFLETLTQEL